MFGFKLWSKFGVFRDPLTITQNITLIAPPKTTIGGMLAAIIGIDYNDYFNDHSYFNFKYSLIMPYEIRKKSFTQNYIEDYTKKSKIKINKSMTLRKITNEERYIDEIVKFYSQAMTKPKPIYRELLINPKYFIFIKNFKYQDKITKMMKKHYSSYFLYMGNTEFAANYKYIDVKSKTIESDMLDSFTCKNDLIKFEPNKKYTKMYAATRTIKDREYRDYKSLIFSNKKIKLKRKIKIEKIETENGIFNCEFI